ncbi:hypothetical protein PTKU46_80150 [Paraburkholderia terrae]|uniref:hypothetical protein n=1 Tax=Paraburkholderia terrae TaxID=311230 RepID=UPI0030E4C872
MKELVHKAIIEAGTALFDEADTRQREHALSGDINTVHVNKHAYDTACALEHEAEQWLAKLLGTRCR